MEISELIARESARDLVARYNANGDTGRFDAVLDLFAPDAVMELPGGELYEGTDQIITIFTKSQSDVKNLTNPGVKPMLRHFTASHQIDVIDEDHAKGRCYYQVLMGTGLDHWGRYIDEYERRDGRWLFSRRRVTLDGWIPGGMGAAYFDE